MFKKGPMANSENFLGEVRPSFLKNNLLKVLDIILVEYYADFDRKRQLLSKKELQLRYNED